LKFEIEGLDEFQKQLEEASKAMEMLGTEIATVTFNPEDPESIETAIKNMEAAIDAKVAYMASNPFVAEIADGMKQQFRQGILDKVAEARLTA
jgi:hypothetical protein